MVTVLVGHHVLLGQRAAAGTELVDEHLEEVRVEIARSGRPGNRTGRRRWSAGPQPGLDRTVRTAWCAGGCSPAAAAARRRRPSCVVATTRHCDESRLASAPVLHWLRSYPGASTRLSCRFAVAAASPMLGSTPRNSAITTISKPPTPPPTAISAAAVRGRRRVDDVGRVNLHTLVEGHCTAPSLATPCSDPGPSSFAHYDLGVAVLCLDIPPSCIRTGGSCAAPPRVVSSVWRGVPLRRTTGRTSAGSWHRPRCSRGPVCADALEHGPAPAAGQVVRRRRSRRSEGSGRGVS